MPINMGLTSLNLRIGSGLEKGIQNLNLRKSLWLTDVTQNNLIRSTVFLQFEHLLSANF